MRVRGTSMCGTASLYTQVVATVDILLDLTVFAYLVRPSSLILFVRLPPLTLSSRRADTLGDDEFPRGYGAVEARLEY